MSAQAGSTSQARGRSSPAVSLYKLIATLTLLGVGVQFFLAGAGAFGATSYEPHRVLGTVLVALGGLGLLLALASRRQVTRAFALEIALVLQLALGHLGTSHPWVGAIHGLVAIIVAALASIVGRGLGVGMHRAHKA